MLREQVVLLLSPKCMMSRFEDEGGMVGSREQRSMRHVHLQGVFVSCRRRGCGTRVYIWSPVRRASGV